MRTFPAHHISVSIDVAPADVYAFVITKANLPRWAAGITPDAVVEFAPPNPFGVLDHDVILPTGETVRSPLRVMPNGDGSELVFTLFQRPGVTAAAFAADEAAVRKDLLSLKMILES